MTKGVSNLQAPTSSANGICYMLCRHMYWYLVPFLPIHISVCRHTCWFISKTYFCTWLSSCKLVLVERLTAPDSNSKSGVSQESGVTEVVILDGWLITSQKVAGLLWQLILLSTHCLVVTPTASGAGLGSCWQLWRLDVFRNLGAYSVSQLYQGNWSGLEKRPRLEQQ